MEDCVCIEARCSLATVPIRQEMPPCLPESLLSSLTPAPCLSGQITVIYFRATQCVTNPAGSCGLQKEE